MGFIRKTHKADVPIVEKLNAFGAVARLPVRYQRRPQAHSVQSPQASRRRAAIMSRLLRQVHGRMQFE